MSKTKKVISIVLTLALVMAMATVAMISASAATTLYFNQPEGWGALNAHYWVDGGESTTWPGVPMTDEGNGVWSIEIPDGYNKLIFNDSDGVTGNQTANLDVPASGMIGTLSSEVGDFEYGQANTVNWVEYDAPVVTTTVAAPVETTVADVETTVADVETTVADVETTVAEPVETTVATEDEPVETTVADEPVETTVAEPVETTAVEEPVETTVAEPVETTVADEADGIVVGGTEYTAKVGDIVTYTATLKTPKAIENIQATTKYDSAKLKLVDATVAERFPNMTGVVANAADGAIYFNASEISAGFDFTAGATLITLQFEVLDASYSEITTTIEEMVEFFGIDYITGGEIVADGVEVTETLEVPVVPTTTTEPTTAETTTTVVEPTQTDVKGTTTGGDPEDPDVPETGANIAIYAVLAALAMAAAAVVVLRKKVNG